jgi:hypothetical protein
MTMNNPKVFGPIVVEIIKEVEENQFPYGILVPRNTTSNFNTQSKTFEESSLILKTNKNIVSGAVKSYYNINPEGQPLATPNNLANFMLLSMLIINCVEVNFHLNNKVDMQTIQQYSKMEIMLKPKFFFFNFRLSYLYGSHKLD